MADMKGHLMKSYNELWDRRQNAESKKLKQVITYVMVKQWTCYKVIEYRNNLTVSVPCTALRPRGHRRFKRGRGRGKGSICRPMGDIYIDKQSTQ
jgi:hypothetical protein